MKQINNSIKYLYNKFKNLSCTEKVGVILTGLVIFLLIVCVGYLMYKMVTLILPLLLLVGLYFLYKSDGLVQTSRKMNPEEYPIETDLVIIAESLYCVLERIGDLLNLKQPSTPEDLYVRVYACDKLLFRVRKNALDKEKKSLLSLEALERALNTELNIEFLKKYEFFKSTVEGLQIMGIVEEDFYYYLLITPINENTKSSVLKKQRQRFVLQESERESDLYDEF